MLRGFRAGEGKLYRNCENEPSIEVHSCEFFNRNLWDSAKAFDVHLGDGLADSDGQMCAKLSAVAGSKLVEVVAGRSGQGRKLNLLVRCAGPQNLQQRGDAGLFHFAIIAAAKPLRQCYSNLALYKMFAFG